MYKLSAGNGVSGLKAPSHCYSWWWLHANTQVLANIRAWSSCCLWKCDRSSGHRWLYNGLTEIWADSYVHPPAASYEVSGELWQLVTTIHDDGDSLILCEWLSWHHGLVFLLFLEMREKLRMQNFCRVLFKNLFSLLYTYLHPSLGGDKVCGESLECFPATNDEGDDLTLRQQHS